MTDKISAVYVSYGCDGSLKCTTDFNELSERPDLAMIFRKEAFAKDTH